MATIWRDPNYAPQPYAPRAFLTPDVLPNLILGVFLASHPQPPGGDDAIDPWTAQTYQRPYVHQDHFLSGTTTRGIPPPPPFFAKALDPNPDRKPFQQVDAPPNLTVIPLPSLSRIFEPPIDIQIYRDPRSYDYLTFDATAYLPPPSQGRVQRLPLQADVYYRRPNASQDFIYNVTIGLPTTPFAQYDWPLFARAPTNTIYQTQGSIQNLSIPPKTVLPFNNYDQPAPYPRARDAYADSYSSPHILIVTPKLLPFRQTEFPLPIRVKDIPQDHIWAGWTTRQKIIPPFYQTDWVTPRPAPIDPIDWQIQGFTTRVIPPPVAPQLKAPNVVGMYVYDAQQAILGAGFLINTPVLVDDENAVLGIVLAQSVTAGQTYPSGSQVQITITVAAYISPKPPQTP